jgi:hypothetical protein
MKRIIFILLLSLVLPAGAENWMLRWTPLQWTNWVRSMAGTNAGSGIGQTNISYLAITNAPWRLSRWTTNQDNVTINGSTLTNAVGIGAGNLIAITTNSTREYTVSASSNVIAELASGAFETPFITTTAPNNTATNILINYEVPTTGLFTLHVYCSTMPKSNTVTTFLPIDSSASLHGYWTDPSGTPMYCNFYQQATWVHYGFNGLPIANDALTKTTTIACRAGTFLIISNYTDNSYEDGDGLSTNHARAALWGRKL